MVKQGVLHFPWKAEDFLFYCCPECDHKSPEKARFIDHAYTHIFYGYDDEAEQTSSYENVPLKMEPVVAIDDEQTETKDNPDESFDLQDFDCLDDNDQFEQDSFENFHETFDYNEDFTAIKKKKSPNKVKKKSLKSPKEPKKKEPSTKSHSYPERQGDLTCWQCNAGSFNSRTLKKHVFEAHGHNRCFKCSKCDKFYTSKETYNAHLSNVHNDDPAPIICYLCPFTTTSSTYMTRHMIRKHAIKGQSQCPHCSYTSTCDEYVRIHINSQHTVKKHPCPECNELFESKKVLREHLIEIHHRQYFSCDRCETKFTTKSGLDGHVLDVHEKSYPFKCTLCPAAYTNSKNLKRHFQRKHDENKPYSCDTCDKKYSIASDLREHLKAAHKKQ